MDSLRFTKACEAIIGNDRQHNGIGTLSEKTLHAVLKHYYEPWDECKEVRIGNYVADIVGEHGIIEIQTNDLGRLRKKLESFLSVCDVTVVYPLSVVKYLRWLDTETGELSDRRKSPKRMTVYDGLKELYKIKYLLKNPRLHICFPLLEIEEIRYLNGWSADRKKGSSRCDKNPLALLDDVHIYNISDYERFVPTSLPEKFTSANFSKECGIKRSTAQTVLNVLTFTGTVIRTGKESRNIIYKRNFQENPFLTFTNE